VNAEGRVLHGGGSTAFCEGEARDESGKLLAKAIGTFRLVQERR
jgi:acyl-coenzyme A thioesterase PaaI-like protein